MPDRSVIVIGAGLAGLAAGIYAQRNGYRSHIFEHASQPGGVAAWWRRGAYHIDGGIHFLMGHRPPGAIHDLYRELGTAAPDTVADMAEYGRWVDEPSGKSAVIHADLDRTAAELKQLSPADGRAIDAFIASARAFQAAGTFDIGMGNPPELAGRLDQAKMLWGMRKVMPYFVGQHSRTAAEHARTLREPVLAYIFENLFLPDAPLWFLYMLFGLLADGQIGLLTQGCEGFVRPIEARYRELGGQISYSATVAKILVEDDRAVGVRLADPDGTEYRADAVISAADGHSTLFEMLDGRFLDDPIRARYRDWRLIKPWAVLSFGVARTFAGEPHFTTYRLAEPIRVGLTQVDLLGVRVLNYSPHFAPAGKAVIQPAFEAEWDYWDGLRQADRAAYDAEKVRVADEVLRRLEVHYPGLRDQVELTDVATPSTTWRYTRNWRGAYMGWLPTAAQMMTTLPRTLPGLGRFVMAGQWVIPGGGVPTCLLSGRDAVRILCKSDGRKFT